MVSDRFNNVTVIEHPVLKRDLTILRDENSSIDKFRGAMKRAASVLACYALKELPLRSFKIKTPLQETTGHDFKQGVMVVPILRAGLSLTDAVLQFVPHATVGHLGMYRDEETLQPVDYYSNIPASLSDSIVLVVDPMLATGGSADGAITHLKEKGGQHLQFMSLISAPEGIKHLQKKHPDVPITTGPVDEKLNDKAFIEPGLGDAGDRYFGTE